MSTRRGGSCPRTAHSGARRTALVTAHASAPERAPVRGHPLAAGFAVDTSAIRDWRATEAGRQGENPNVLCVFVSLWEEGTNPVAGFRARGGCRFENPAWTRLSTAPRATHDRSFRRSGTGCDRTCWSAASGRVGTPDMTGSAGAQTAAQWPRPSLSCREAARCLILNRVARE